MSVLKGTGKEDPPPPPVFRKVENKTRDHGGNIVLDDAHSPFAVILDRGSFRYHQTPIFQHPFFRKQFFFSKICFGYPPPSKFLEVCLNSGYT